MIRFFPYFLIAVLLGVIVYLVLFYTEAPHSPQEDTATSSISVSEEIETMSQADDVPEVEDISAPISLLAISGTLIRFEEEGDENGRLIVWALIDDGTEFIRIDMRRIVQPGVSAPEDQLGLDLGQMVTIRGELTGDVFRAVSID